MKRLIFFISQLLVLTGAVFFTTFRPVEQAIYFLILFLLTCLSAMILVERFVKRHDVIRRLNTIHPLIGIVMGTVVLAVLVGGLIWLAPSLTNPSLIGLLVIFLSMYSGILVLGFIISCFFEGITRQPKDQLIRPVFLFIGTGYLILTVFGILQLYRQTG
ncbi:hypothetical protein AS033_14160 [Exiguobacterium indicum]|uniref:Uncharacterized protein n=1 Tax=Exiguobacterium indicum TaxID=296995 RepID=A0A0V8GC47_9BACL|nr:hypothetical protein [Exiguobacterium enclense]KSU47803.1 hypothetical protein AS033_14160 [Exiguobacterium enclense]SDD26626.1 hypothetical protein SAMN05216342_2883 [Exiguobacterium enclense]